MSRYGLFDKSSEVSIPIGRKIVVTQLLFFKARFDKKVEKEYLLGRYGAIPIFRQASLDSAYTEDGTEDEKVDQ